MMKKLLGLIALLFATFTVYGAPYQVGAANSYFTQSSGALFAGAYLTDATFIRTQGVTRMIYNCTVGGVGNYVCGQIITGASWTQPPTNQKVIPDVCRFPYVFLDNSGLYYMTCNKGSNGNGNVYLYSSSNGGASWVSANGGEPIVTQEPGTTWAYIWNVAVQIVGDRWIMLAESGATSSRMDLSLSTATLTGGAVNFNPGKVYSPVIANGGNPEISLLPDGKTLVATHGLYKDGRFANAWYLTISTASIAGLTSWVTHRDGFAVGEPGIDIADPTTVDADGNHYIVFSYNQNQLRMINATLPISEMYSHLLGR